MRLLTFFVVFIILNINASHAQDSDVPVIRYQIELLDDGEIVIIDSDGNVVEQRTTESPLANGNNNITSGSDMVARPDDGMRITTGPMPNYDNAWVVLDGNGNPTAVGPAGSAMVLENLGEGDSLQVVEGWGTDGFEGAFSANAGFFSRRPSLEEMEVSIRQQMRRAWQTVQEEACTLMRDYQSVTISFEVGASAIVSAKVLGEGTFVPAEVCP